MAERFDVIVVGARCAGSPLAARLARRGLRVCVVDRAKFPSEVPSTHLIHSSGVASLSELGLLDKLLATGAPPFERGGFVIDDVRIEGSADLVRKFEAPWLCIRRSVLDPLLAGAAEEAGAQVRTGVTVTALVEEAGAVRGVRTETETLLASVVVGADGPHSVVARSVGAREYHFSPPGRLFMWAYFEGVDAPGGLGTLGRIGDLGFLGLHTDAGLFVAGIAPSMDERRSYLSDVDASFDKGLARIEEVADLVNGARRVGPVRVMARWHGYFRESSGPGWALVGDAGHFKDPTPAQGIADALRQGERLALAIEHGLGRDLDAELRAWWRWRDADAWDMYWFACDMGAGGSGTPLVREMLRALSQEHDGAERFLRLLNHELAPSELFGARQALGTLARTAIRQPGQLPAMLGETREILTERRRRQNLLREPQFDVTDVSTETELAIIEEQPGPRTTFR